MQMQGARQSSVICRAAAYLLKGGYAGYHVVGCVGCWAVGHHCLEVPPAQRAQRVLQARKAVIYMESRWQVLGLATCDAEEALHVRMQTAGARLNAACWHKQSCRASSVAC